VPFRAAAGGGGGTFGGGRGTRGVHTCEQCCFEGGGWTLQSPPIRVYWWMFGRNGRRVVPNLRGVDRFDDGGAIR